MLIITYHAVKTKTLHGTTENEGLSSLTTSFCQSGFHMKIMHAKEEDKEKASVDEKMCVLQFYLFRGLSA